MPDYKHSVPLKKLIDEFKLEEIYVPSNLDDVRVFRSDVNRPGLPLTGFFDYFEAARIQILGRAESIYLAQFSDAEMTAKLDAFFSRHPVAVVIAHNIDVPEQMVALAKQYDVPLLRTATSTSGFMSALIASLNVHLAPRITRHGVLVEVYGDGILILGDSGVGKSETAIELIKRGHRLVADDAVEISKVSNKALVGKAPDIIRYYVELRGIGIIDVRQLFGMGAVKESEQIHLVIKLEPWVEGKMYDRLGLDSETIDILGIEVPMITIPVRPGRNIAIIIEIAAMNHHMRKIGYNTAEEFNRKLMQQFEQKG